MAIFKAKPRLYRGLNIGSNERNLFRGRAEALDPPPPRLQQWCPVPLLSLLPTPKVSGKQRNSEKQREMIVKVKVEVRNDLEKECGPKELRCLNKTQHIEETKVMIRLKKKTRTLISFRSFHWGHAC